MNGNRLPVNVQSLSDTVKYVQQKSQADKCILYHGFISLSADEVITQGFKNRTRWKELLSSKMADVAKVNNIKIENLEWISAYHMKKDQSHCHLIFWDKNQDVKDPYVPRIIFDEKMEWIRGQFAKAVFQDTFKELYNRKDEAFKEIKTALHPFFNDFNTIIDEMTDDEFKTLKEQLSSISPDFADEEMINPKFSDKQLEYIAKEIMHIKAIAPSKGGLKYQYMSPNIKAEIDKAVMKIIMSNAACKSAYHTYLNTAEEIRKVYADNPDSIKDARDYAHNAILKSIGNKLLKAVKEVGEIEKEIGTKEWTQKQELYQKQAAGNLIMQIARMLTRGSKSNQAKANRLKNSELSKQARIDLAKKLENRSLDWGQYER